MSEIKHAPGPWSINRDGRFITSIGPLVAEEYAGSAWLEVSEEDALLIAAAPELLKALRVTMRALSHTVSHLYSKRDPTDEIGDMIKESRELFHKALDKATGSQS